MPESVLEEVKTHSRQLLASSSRGELLLYLTAPGKSDGSIHTHLGVIDKNDGRTLFFQGATQLILYPGVYIGPDNKELFHVSSSYGSVLISKLSNPIMGKEGILDYLHNSGGLSVHNKWVSSLQKPYRFEPLRSISFVNL